MQTSKIRRMAVGALIGVGATFSGALWAHAALAQEMKQEVGPATGLTAAPAADAPAPQMLQGGDPLRGMTTPRLVPSAPSPEAATCADAAAAPKQRAEACSTLISSGKWQGEQISWAYANRCVAFLKLDLRDKARPDCDKALALDPKNLVALQVRGMLARDRGDDVSALDDFDRAAALGLKNAALFLDRGNILLARGDIDKALADYEQAVRLSPDNAVGYLARANARMAAGDLAAAAADGAKADQLAPASEPAAFTHGVAALLDHDRAAAVPALRKAVNLAPNDPYPALWLRLAGETAQDGLRASADRPDAPWPAPVARYLLGTIDGDKLSKAAQKPAERCEAMFYSGAALLNKGDKDAARPALRQALDLCPKNFIEYGGARAFLHDLEASAAEAPKPDAAKSEPVKSEPAKSEPVKSEPPKSDEAQPDAKKSDASEAPPTAK